jgi:hypothetical protein
LAHPPSEQQPQLSSGNEDEATDADSEEEPLNIISSLLHPAAKHRGKDYPDDLLSRAQDLLKEFHDPEVDHDGENILTNDIGNGEAPGMCLALQFFRFLRSASSFISFCLLLRGG